MKKIIVLTALLFTFYYNAFSQDQPTKEVTLNYINEKIRDYSVEYSKIIEQQGVFTFSDGESKPYYDDIYIKSGDVEIIEDNNRLNLKCNWRSREVVLDVIYQNTETYTDNWISIVPFDQLESIEIFQPRTERYPGFPINNSTTYEDKLKTWETSYLALNFSSDCVLCKHDDNTTEYVNYFIIGFREGEENLLEKLQRAFLNLLTYYPKVDNDPFSK